MCVYIYSEDGLIKIPFMSESIYLHTHGSAENHIDILMENISNNIINSFILIYPNNFYKIIHKKNEFKRHGGFTNNSSQLDDENDKVNLTYKLSGYLRTVSRDSYLTLQKPNPNNLNVKIEYKGLIPPDTKYDIFKPYNGLEDIAWHTLNAIHMSIFRYKFNTPMKLGEKRWIRLHFKPKKVATYHPKPIKHFLLWFINDLQFTYCIMSPTDVKNIFEERLNLHHHLLKQNIVNAGAKDLPMLEKQLRAIKSITDKITNVIDKTGVTAISDLTLHIFSGKLRILKSIFAHGNIEPNGTLPNFISEDKRLKSNASWARRVYDWTALDLDSFDKKSSFSIYFSSEVQNRILSVCIVLTTLFIITNTMFTSILSLTFYLQQRSGADYLNEFYSIIKNINNFIFVKYPIITFVIGLIIFPIGRYLLVWLKKLKEFVSDYFK